MLGAELRSSFPSQLLPDQDLPSSVPSKTNDSKFDTLSIILIGLGRIMACHCFLWNTGLGVGVIPFYLINIFWSIGVTCMSLCLAEMASALPFTGGVYGFSRGLIGPYFGFLVGIFEFLGNITLIGVFAILFGQSVTTFFGLHDIYLLFFLVIPLGIAVSLQYAGRQKFGMAVKVCTCLSLLLFLIYVFGSAAHVSLGKYGNNPNASPPSHTYKLRQVFQRSNYGAAFFAGIEGLPVISSDSQRPHVSIPWTLFVVNVFYCISFTCVIMLAAWQEPGIREVSRATLPLSYGYANMFGVSTHFAAIFNIPAALTSIIVCVYYLCVTLRSMALSGVLPTIFGQLSSKNQVPTYALILIVVGTVLVAAMILAGLLFYEAFALSVLIFGTYSLYFIYAAIFVTYLVFHRHYNDKQHRFQSPLGPYGAYIGLFMTCCLVIANNYPYHPYLRNSLLIFIGTIFLLSVVYVFVMVRYQKYSPEEEKIFFIAYIIRANRRHREAIRRAKHHHSIYSPSNSHPANGNQSLAPSHQSRSHSSNRSRSSDNPPDLFHAPEEPSAVDLAQVPRTNRPTFFARLSMFSFLSGTTQMTGSPSSSATNTSNNTRRIQVSSTSGAVESNSLPINDSGNNSMVTISRNNSLLSSSLRRVLPQQVNSQSSSSLTNAATDGGSAPSLSGEASQVLLFQEEDQPLDDSAFIRKPFSAQQVLLSNSLLSTSLSNMPPLEQSLRHDVVCVPEEEASKSSYGMLLSSGSGSSGNSSRKDYASGQWSDSLVQPFHPE